MTGAAPPAGVIIPPPGIREIVAKTAGYVQRNGEAFIERVRAKESQNSKFSFLFADNVYYPYFKWYLAEGWQNDRPSEQQDGSQKDKESLQTGGGLATTSTPNSTTTTTTKLHFSQTVPPVSPQDLEIIKLTALYAARNGKSFVDSLALAVGEPEYRTQFAFLAGSHSLHGLYTGYVDQYRRTMSPTSDMEQRLDQVLGKNRYQVLTSARMRAEQQTSQAEKNKAAEEQARKEQMEFAQIDWQDFVVVETIEFGREDHRLDLEPPLSLAQIQFAPLAEKQSGRFIQEAPPDYEADGHEPQAKRVRV